MHKRRLLGFWNDKHIYAWFWTVNGGVIHQRAYTRRSASSPHSDFVRRMIPRQTWHPAINEIGAFFFLSRVHGKEHWEASKEQQNTGEHMSSRLLLCSYIVDGLRAVVPLRIPEAEIHGVVAGAICLSMLVCDDAANMMQIPDRGAYNQTV
jgi:hypothetical protein